LNTIEELFQNGKYLLKEYPYPALESKLLLLASTSMTEDEFLAMPKKKPSRISQRRFYRLIFKRLHGFPLVYLTGEKEFWSINFKVAPGVLIPRPETELVVEKALEFMPQKNPLIADIGTGCGNIALSIAKELPQAKIVATDISSTAIQISRMNASIQSVSNVTFIQGDMYEPLKKSYIKKKFHMILSNPPYVSLGEWKKLPQEIRDHEPKEALLAGRTGLEFIKKLIKDAAEFLEPRGYLIFEIGYNQKERVRAMFGNGWKEVHCFEDINSIPRVYAARI